MSKNSFLLQGAVDLGGVTGRLAGGVTRHRRQRCKVTQAQAPGGPRWRSLPDDVSLFTRSSVLKAKDKVRGEGALRQAVAAFMQDVMEKEVVLCPSN